LKNKVLIVLLATALTALLVYLAVPYLAANRSAPPVSPESASTPVPAAQETPAFAAVFSKGADANSLIHEVKPGQNLTFISKKYKVTVDLIKKINQLSSDRLMPGMKLKIPTFVFSLVIDKSQNSLVLKGGEEVLKIYPCSTGENNSTPVGVFKIKDKLVNPTWYKAGTVVPFGSPKNVLVTRWMGFTKAGYGIHGTTEPEKIGRQVTAGCVRLRNEDVEELYALIPVGTEATLVD
jgi:lipoprotein-anchoring transpeptidase ErfK/SrfK